MVISSEAHNLPPEEGFTAGISGYFDKSEGHSALVRFIHDFTQRNFVDGRVLHVEDDLTTARATQSLLETSGLDLVHNTKAEQALEMLEPIASVRTASDHACFDLVLTNNFLKGSMTAVDLVPRIRSLLLIRKQHQAMRLQAAQMQRMYAID